jgi:hypothetical protein
VFGFKFFAKQFFSIVVLFSFAHAIFSFFAFEFPYLIISFFQLILSIAPARMPFSRLTPIGVPDFPSFVW